MRVSFKPRSAPAAMVCMPSAMKKLAPMVSRVAASAIVAPFSTVTSPRKASGMMLRVAIASTAIAAMKTAPSAIAVKPARRVASASRLPTA